MAAFAEEGFSTTFLARDRSLEKAEAGLLGRRAPAARRRRRRGGGRRSRGGGRREEESKGG